MPFNQEKPKERKTGLKINNSTSSVEPPKVPTSIAFEKQADEAFAKKQALQSKIWELSAKFKSIVQDTILPENKTQVSKNLETETLTELINFGIELDNDPNEGEYGSTPLCMILMKISLLQRDAINSLSYKISKLEKQISDLKNQKPSDV